VEKEPAANDRKMASTEPEDENKFGCRPDEGTAHTLNFGTGRGWSWVGKSRGARCYCFWKLSCNLAGALSGCFD
jgi:hypothetical protein